MVTFDDASACISHEECSDYEYCDIYQNCWDSCSECWTFQDPIDGECPPCASTSSDSWCYNYYYYYGYYGDCETTSAGVWFVIILALFFFFLAVRMHQNKQRRLARIRPGQHRPPVAQAIPVHYPGAMQGMPQVQNGQMNAFGGNPQYPMANQNPMANQYPMGAPQYQPTFPMGSPQGQPQQAPPAYGEKYYSFFLSPVFVCVCLCLKMH